MLRAETLIVYGLSIAKLNNLEYSSIFEKNKSSISYHYVLHRKLVLYSKLYSLK